ncbi:hypothetical protein [Roseateles sp.]|uniref:hypothetical protein n=1 Tax=Roseateles sp. TaxID=1971397 RepID=UPI003BAC9328
MLKPGSWAWQWRDAETQEVIAALGIIGGATQMILTPTTSDLSMNERIDITRTPCKLGGSRAWFKCPKCSGRVAKLHLRGGRFACRICQRLTYASQSEDLIARLWRQQAKIEAKLGRHWQRPKHMHQTTFERLRRRLWDLEAAREEAFALAVRRMGWLL